VPTGADQAAVLAIARPAAANWIEGKTVLKEIVVPGKLVNFVVQ
jgi:leucyl-tRNA synthetase